MRTLTTADPSLVCTISGNDSRELPSVYIRTQNEETYHSRRACILVLASSGERNRYTQSRYSATNRWKIPCASAPFCVALNLGINTTLTRKSATYTSSMVFSTASKTLSLPLPSSPISSKAPSKPLTSPSTSTPFPFTFNPSKIWTSLG